MSIFEVRSPVRIAVGVFAGSTTGAILACLLDTPTNGAWLYFIMIFIGAYIFAILIGLPLVALLGVLQLNTLTVFVLAFFLVGTVVFGLLNIFVSTRMYGLEVDGITLVVAGHITGTGIIYVLKNASQLGALCAIGASIFWAVSIRK